MDSQISIIVFFILIYGAYLYYKKVAIPKFKGRVGEFNVSQKLKRLREKEFIVLNDLLIKNGDHTTQIDHVVISKGGVFVIETKNYQGWIHGHENSESWTQTIYKRKTKFRNPIKQNWAHVYVLKKILTGYSSIKYYPIVVFSDRSTLKNITSEFPVIYTKQLIRTIKTLNRESNLSIDQMRGISDKINELNNTNWKENRKHIKQVKQQIKEDNRIVRSGLCPRCGSSLVKRKGKFGKFYGCSNFPSFRYTLKNNQ